MAFGRQVHHQVRIGLAHRVRRGLGIAEIHQQQGVAALAAGIEGLGAMRSRTPPCQQPADHRPADIYAVDLRP